MTASFAMPLPIKFYNGVHQEIVAVFCPRFVSFIIRFECKRHERTAMARGRFLLLPSLILLLVYIRNMVAVGDGARPGEQNFTPAILQLNTSFFKCRVTVSWYRRTRLLAWRRSNSSKILIFLIHVISLCCAYTSCMWLSSLLLIKYSCN